MNQQNRIRELEKECADLASRIGKYRATEKLIEQLAAGWVETHLENDVNQGEDPEELVYYAAGREIQRILTR